MSQLPLEYIIITSMICIARAQFDMFSLVLIQDKLPNLELIQAMRKAALENTINQYEALARLILLNDNLMPPHLLEFQNNLQDEAWQEKINRRPSEYPSLLSIEQKYFNKKTKIL